MIDCSFRDQCFSEYSDADHPKAAVDEDQSLRQNPLIRDVSLTLPTLDQRNKANTIQNILFNKSLLLYQRNESAPIMFSSENERHPKHQQRPPENTQ
jgi:hypothetical protein